ncbi:MAG: phospholipid carrier-dependent glycosyltransferase [Chloroflexi bacterium]|nr:phospholipid carrier-dependent glycosyltransferase [Chloroflexota bacterium]
MIGVIFLFFFLLYTLTGGGHVYSAEGEHAYAISHSLLLEPEREGLQQDYRELASWELGLPVLMQPTLLLGAIIDPLLPQRDAFGHQGDTYVLGEYPVLARRGTPNTRDTLHIPLEDTRAKALVIFSNLESSQEIKEGSRIATITFDTVPVGRFFGEVKAGRDTAEAAYDLSVIQGGVAHGKAETVARRIGMPRSNIYVSELQFTQRLTVKSITIQYHAQEGALHISSLNLIDAETDEPILIGSTGRVWSEQENSDYFRRLFALFTNAWVTALSAVLMFLITRRLGYHSQVALALTLLFGLATLAWPYAKYDYTEPGIALALLGTVYFLLRGVQDRQLGWILVSGLIIVCGIAIKFVTAINLAVLVPLPALVSFQGSRQFLRSLAWALVRTLVFLAPIGLVGLVALVALVSASDLESFVPTDLIERLSAGLDLPTWIGLYGNLLSPGKSVLLYAPPLILALFGSLPFISRHKWWSLPFACIPLIYLLIYSSAGDWYGGSTWGPRYLVPAVPLLLVMAAPILEKALFDNGVRELRAAVVLGAVGIGMQLLAVANNFERYFSLLRSQVLPQIPESGAFLAGRVGQAYYAHPANLPADKESVLYLFATPFSPIFAHIWILAADTVDLFLISSPEILRAVLSRPPWTLLGVAIWPQHPEEVLGLDFWSMTLWRDFTNHAILLAFILIFVLACQAATLYCWTWLSQRFELSMRLYWGGIIGLATFFILFDVSHILQ